MSKKLISVFLISVLLLSISVGCSNQEAGTDAEKAGSNGDVPYKIGIMTGTVSQGEEEYQAALELKEKYGDMIIHTTYPDDFTSEQETTISQIVNMSADPNVKAIIICQAVPGTAAAIDKIRENRDDIFFIAGVPHEDPELISEKADIVMEVDNLMRGKTIIELAEKLGAETFIHYTFPRHMSYELLAQRRDIFEEECKKRDIEFVSLDAPDPTSDAGISGAQQFILEDVPRQIEKYGKDTALFSTNCGMQEPLIKAALNEGAIYAEQCCPSPYHAYPGALGIEIPEDKAGDVDFILDQIEEKIVEKGGAGRFASWKVPANMAIIRASVEYAKMVIEDEVEGIDIDTMKELLVEATGGGQIKLRAYEKAPNFLMFVGESKIFGEE